LKKKKTKKKCTKAKRKDSLPKERKLFLAQGKKRRGNRWLRRKMLPQSWNLKANENNLLVPWTSLGRHGRVERHQKKNLCLQRP
jgi:hypothetical protein